jgi:hypothetical protein
MINFILFYDNLYDGVPLKVEIKSDFIFIVRTLFLRDSVERRKVFLTIFFLFNITKVYFSELSERGRE